MALKLPGRRNTRGQLNFVSAHAVLALHRTYQYISASQLPTN
ncbi:hypothetical protein Fuma_04286 [Fuerstiella marisgermanici]|uniref:Uncharacterized protein n=1 Tax=Fuerstiella marisgermanici TaxID=1891926 RepID=A0A1P8WKT3_9PLAN|nr:hypothetical protein Fuma_04286 [Fuerstiella marisgermanici]